MDQPSYDTVSLDVLDMAERRRAWSGRGKWKEDRKWKQDFQINSCVNEYIDLLYLISKYVHVIGRNRVTWRLLNLANGYFPHEPILPPFVYVNSASTDQYCLHVQFDFSKQQLEPLDWQI